jgi:hypothetical protein
MSNFIRSFIQNHHTSSNFIINYTIIDLSLYKKKIFNEKFQINFIEYFKITIV